MYSSLSPYSVADSKHTFSMCHFFLCTVNTDAPQGVVLGLMNPLFIMSFNISFHSRNFTGAMLYEEIKIG